MTLSKRCWVQQCLVWVGLKRASRGVHTTHMAIGMSGCRKANKGKISRKKQIKHQGITATPYRLPFCQPKPEIPLVLSRRHLTTTCTPSLATYAYGPKLIKLNTSIYSMAKRLETYIKLLYGHWKRPKQGVLWTYK
ncbi:hypothetical protein AFLA_004997 [Aspergillus flavus NRRL3357]|nr:hypothetical protein AFLA_004997 [Aspergillus flavus NRRL3357]